MKKLTFLIIFIIVMSVFAGCYSVETVVEEDTTEKAEPELQTVLYESYTDIEADVIVPESDEFSWYKMPFLRATDIHPVRNGIYRGCVYSLTPTDYGYHPTEYVAYYIGNKCGVADSYGNILCDALYTEPFFCPEPNSVAFSDHRLAYDFEKREVCSSGGHGGGAATLYYDLNSERYICISGSEGDNETVGYDKQGVHIVHEAYMELTGSYEFYDSYKIESTGKIGLYRNQRLVIPFEYVAAAEICEDVVAMYDGNKWTYFSVYGKVIMDDVPSNSAFFSYYETLCSETGEFVTRLTEINAVYSYSQGSVPVKKDGKWGYMDKNGEMIIETVFDKALPAFEGRAWVCVDGYWGIIEI